MFTPEGREISPQFSAVNRSFMWITLPISGEWGMGNKWCREDYEAIISDGDNALAQGIFEQVKAIVDIKFGHKIGLMPLHCFWAKY